MSKKETEVAEGHSDDDEEKKIRHLMQKYGWSHQEALEYYHYEQHDPKDYEDMEESNEQSVAEAAKWRDAKHKDKLYTQEPGDSDDYDNIGYGYDFPERPENDPGQKRRMGGIGDKYDRTDPLEKGYGRYGAGSPVEKGPRKGLPSRSHITSLKGSIKNAHGKHHAPNLPEQMNESVELNAMLALNKRLNG
jgi:hypothetical protein